jgi:thioesterase domain-containing protein
MKKHDLDQLVVFNSGTDDISIVFVHPVGGQVHWYREIAKQFDKRFFVYALLSAGLIKEDCPFFSVEKMADSYIKNILNKPAQKHYIIIGWSFGCEVAFEIVKGLIEKQHKASLVLLDPQVMIKKHDGISSCFHEVLKKEYGVDLKKDIDLFDLDIDSVNQFILELVEHMVSSGQIKEAYKKYYVMALRVYLYNIINMYHYQRVGQVQNVLLVAAKENKKKLFSFMKQATKLNWQPYVQSIKKSIALGDHYSMLQGQSAYQIVSEINQSFLGLETSVKG